MKPQCDACSRHVGHTHPMSNYNGDGSFCDRCLHMMPGDCADECVVCDVNKATHRFSCRHCGDPIAMETVEDGWFHVHSGWTKCGSGMEAQPTRSRSELGGTVCHCGTCPNCRGSDRDSFRVWSERGGDGRKIVFRS